MITGVAVITTAEGARLVTDTDRLASELSRIGLDGTWASRTVVETQA